MKPAKTALERLLCWYPRAWRERYGEEFLAMIEDTLDGRRLTLPLRLSVTWGGLRERAHTARRAGQAAAGRLSARLRVFNRWWVCFVAGFVLCAVPENLRASPPPAMASRAAALLDAEIGVAALAGAALLAAGTVALPALGRFLLAGGWPKIRRRIAWAMAMTAASAGGLAGLYVATSSMTFGQLSVSWVNFLGVVVTTLLLTVALWLWARAITATARQIDLSRRARNAHRALAATMASLVMISLAVNCIWLSVISTSTVSLVIGVSGLATQGLYLTGRLRLAIRSDRRLRPGAARRR